MEIGRILSTDYKEFVDKVQLVRFCLSNSENEKLSRQ